jgi:hypothetical protein
MVVIDCVLHSECTVTSTHRKHLMLQGKTYICLNTHVAGSLCEAIDYIARYYPSCY